jgi:hypothetical protein
MTAPPTIKGAQAEKLATKALMPPNQKTSND